MFNIASMTVDSYFSPKPKSILEVSISVRNGHDYTCAVKEFIDEVISLSIAPKTRYDFYTIPRSVFEDEPLWLDNSTFRAHLAGLAENLALLTGEQPPVWSEEEIYFLKTPVILGGARSHSHIVKETGSAFRRRLLFCGVSLSKFFEMRPRPAH